MQKRDLGKTGLKVAPLIFGGNVLGWTADEAASFRVLDAFVDHGFNAIDTADVYSAWVPGNKGGESEEIIGKWLRSRPGARDKVTIFTKAGSVGGGPHPGGLSEMWLLQAADRSLLRLGIDKIDLYFSHWPDPNTEISETLGAFEKLRSAGKIGSVGASNVNAEQLSAALDEANKSALPAYQVVQLEYNLCTRRVFEGALQDFCRAQGLGVVTYYSLAAGFLSGKYRSKSDLRQSVRGTRVANYMTEKGMAILSAVDAVCSTHSAEPADVALAWIMAQPGITAPIASATKVSHVAAFARACEIKLTSEELALLSDAGA